MRNRARRGLAACMVFGVLVSAARAQMRVVAYNVVQLQGVQADLQAVFAALNTDDKDGFAVTPAIYVFEEVLNANVTPLLNLLNAAAPPGVTYAGATYTNFNEDPASGAEALYYRTNPPLATEITGHTDIFTGAGRYTDRWKMKLVGYDSPNAIFYIYVTHLAASDAAARTTGANNIRNNADAFPAGTRIIYAGDFNFSSNSETAYLRFLAAGNGQAVDPLGSGSWSGSGNAIKHTQSPCTSCPPSLVGGGLDDRFDLQLSTQSFQNGTGLALMGVPSAYRSFGNDGLHYNVAINAGNNSYYPGDIPRSNALASKLVDAADHLPVVVDYQIPAVMAVSLPPDFGRVIQGATFNVTLSVSNTAAVVVANGADTLNFSAIGTGGLSGSAGGSVQALAPAANRDFAVNTSTVGAVNGTVQVTSSNDGVQNPFLEPATSGLVVRHSRGSFSNSAQLTNMTVSSVVPANSGLRTIPVSVYNYGFDSQQALLNVSGLSGGAAPFGLTGGLPTNIGAAAGTLNFTFDTTGASGAYQAALTINLNDESLPGATGATLSLSLSVLVPVHAPDINCDSIVDLADVDAMAAVLLGTDTTPCHVGQADMDGSGSPNGNDIIPFIVAFTNP